MYFNIIGAGRLGTCLALSLLCQKENKLQAVCNRSLSSAKKAVGIIKAGVAVETIDALPKADIIFIVTPDDAIASIVEALAQIPDVEGTVVVHCSGVHASTILLPLKEKKCSLASVHPLKAFTDGVPSAKSFVDCDCIIEGDKRASTMIAALFRAMGGHITTLSTEKKALYHAAAVVGSNYLVTLADCTVNMLCEAGIPSKSAKQMTERLMRINLDNISRNDCISDALTGPIARGDSATISLHMQAISNTRIKKLYQAAGLLTLDMTSHSNEVADKIRLLLD